MRKLSSLHLIGLVLATGAVLLACGVSHESVPRDATAAQVSVIVQAETVDAAAEAVRRLGGDLTHELRVIRSVGARVTPSALQALKADPEVRVYLDRSVAVDVAPGTWTVLDRFETKSYANNDGTQSFSGNWTEINDDGDAGGGDVKIDKGAVYLKNASRGIQRELDMSDATSAVLSFAFRRENYRSAEEFVSVEVSPDGGATFYEAGRIAGPGKDSSYLAATFDISSFSSDRTVVRLTTSTAVGKKKLFVDDFQVEFTIPEPTLPPPPVETGFFTIEDQLNAVAYDGSDGTRDWLGPWVETGDDVAGDPAAGSLYISSYGHMYLLDSNRTLTRHVDLGGASWAQFSFYAWRHYYFEDANDFVAVEISSDGGTTWSELDRLSGPGYDSTWRWYNYNITAHASSDVAIRIRSSESFGADDKLNLSSFAIEYFVDAESTEESDIVAASTLVGADELHGQGLTGRNVTVAVLDSGYWSHSALDYSAAGYRRVKAQYDSITGRIVTINGAASTESSSLDCHVQALVLGGLRRALGPVQSANRRVPRPSPPSVSDSVFLTLTV